MMLVDGNTLAIFLEGRRYVVDALMEEVATASGSRRVLKNKLST
jgi:hypothetical protein